MAVGSGVAVTVGVAVEVAVGVGVKVPLAIWITPSMVLPRMSNPA